MCLELNIFQHNWWLYICLLWNMKPNSRLPDKISVNYLYLAFVPQLLCNMIWISVLCNWYTIYGDVTFVFILNFQVPPILAMKLQCIQLHHPITNSSSSSNRNRQQQLLLLLLRQLLGQGPPLRKRHHSKISNWNQNSLPNHPRSTTVTFARSAVLDHRYLYYVFFYCTLFYYTSFIISSAKNLDPLKSHRTVEWPRLERTLKTI